ncbi:Eco57I restriction-modification methylase domain-containing protein [Paraclostridium bifermentans]|uniref:Eco57I restriction-modification methylase domain-containing protein n=1 Tax=Paraclostridium bifermentans TaxID=1490 RepID=UPI00359CA8AD
MDNKQTMLSDVLTKEFNEIKFNQFIINLLNLDIEDRLSENPKLEGSSVYKNHIEYVKDIGRYKDENKKDIVVSIIKLKCLPENTRTLQRNFIAKHLKDIGADAAIVALYSDVSDIWRISFVKLDYTFDINGLTETITPAKRYSYLIEPKLKNHTVQEQLKNLLFNDSKKPTVEEIENVFSVEIVTTEFFKTYRDKYIGLKKVLRDNDILREESERLKIELDIFLDEFSKKLMGQMAFLYFLQKKGWLGVKIVPKKIERLELRELYKRQNEETREIITKTYKSSESFMIMDREIIKNLSDNEADILASVFKNSKYDEEWGQGSKTFIRDIFEVSKKSNKNFFNDYLQPLFYNALNKRRGSNEYFKEFNCKIPFLNGGLFEPIHEYNWEDIDLLIPNEFFSNKDNSGILDFFDMYNFTINEDEPLEKEVAVDPEMLGKIFESLLDVEERKSKGAFYTPREIVHNMCQDCLVNYLYNETSIDMASLEIFIKYGDILKDADIKNENKEDYKMPKVIVENLDIIDKALENVSIADPSVGSGAFPLGMLNEIVKSRCVITEYMTKNLNEWDRDDKREERSLYKLKKHAMKKSIFAVDIDSSAVDITKLRLWLSLVVDADVKTVNTLPNLDYNIMVGNSLVDEFEGIKLFDEELLKNVPKNKKIKSVVSSQITMTIENGEIEYGMEQEKEILEEIQTLQSKLFDIKDTKEKLATKKLIESKEWDLIEYKLTRDGRPEKLKELKKLIKEKRKPYFLWKLEFSKIFKNKGGFDIVIGNPPYGAKLSKEDKAVIKKKLVDTSNMNTAAVFIDYAKNQWVRSKGIVSYIVPKSLLYSEAWFTLIRSMLNNIDCIIDVEKAFEGVKLEQVVFVYNSNLKKDNYRAKKFLNDEFTKNNVIKVDIVDDLKSCICDVDKKEIDILSKLNNKNLVYMNEISMTKRGVGIQKLVSESGQVPVLGGKNIFRFGIDGIYGYVTKEDLDKNSKKLEFMSQPKIISQDIVAHVQNPSPHILLTSTFDEGGQALTLDTCQNTILTHTEFDYRYVMGILNSKFVSWYTYKFIYCSAIRTMHFDKYYVGKIRIPAVPREEQSRVVEIVKAIESYTAIMSNKKDKTYDKEINKLKTDLDNEVYKLYGFDKKDIATILD